MAKRRELELALLAALIAASSGCAGKSVLPWSKPSGPPQSMEELHARNQSQSQPSAWKRASDSIATKFTPKPKVIAAEDQVSLSTQPKQISAEVYVRAARIHESRGNFTDAKGQYHKALEVDAKDLTALVGLARLHDRQQEFAQAEKLYRQAAAVDPKSALVHNDLGLCYARQKRLGEAQQSLEVAVKLQPLNKMYRNNLATVLMESGRQEEAWTHLVAVNEPAVAHYNMAFLLHQRKQDDAAAQHLHSALQIDGSLSPAAQLLAKIEGRTGTTEELVIEEPSGDMPSYSISDEPVVESPSGEHVMVANSGPGELVNPLAPSTRRSATYRMPPTEEQAIDPAPRPTRLPEAPQAEYAEEVELAPPGVDDDFPARRIAHEEEVELRQPKNVIKLLGELEAAPTPEE